ncbi:MAG: MFS transporter [Pyrinomonadaceae bacterium]
MAAEVETPTSETGEAQPKHAGGMFRALSHRNFRLFWAGAFLSNTGTWMQAVAQGLLISQLTNSPFWLSFDGFMATSPGLVLALAGGVFADLVDRKRLLIFTQIGAGLAALTLAALIYAGVVHDAKDIWIVLLITFVTGCCMSLAGPSYQAITIDLVGREDLANAIALNSAQFQLSRVMGPTLAGLALAALGIVGCFFANGLSYIAIVASLAMVRIERKSKSAQEHSMKDKRALWNDLIDGFRYVWKRPRVFWLLMISAVTSMFGAPYLSLIPYFARNILHLDAPGLSLMMGMSGAGAFFGAIVLIFLGDFKYKGWSVLGGAFSFALCLIGFSLATRLIVSLVFIFGMGVAIVCCVAVINMLLQQLVTDKMRGRVMSMFMLSFIGAMPIGNLMAGAASHSFGAPHTLAVGGLITAAFVAYVALRDNRLREL